MRIGKANGTIPAAPNLIGMNRYYFDLREGSEVWPDEEGMVLQRLSAVKTEAAKSLADMVKDAENTPHTLSILVRDKFGLVLQANLTFEVLFATSYQ